ncbi:MAG: acyltransferase [Solirubrobacteraceae bacterium]|nr:acyltransferase [Solirubrobacteraceae bacterium]
MNSFPRANGLDGLRGLAAAAVVLLHVWMFSGAHDASQPILLDETVGAMGLALMMFFVLSGYLVSAPWIKVGLHGGPAPDLWRYAVRRAARILPAYWISVVASYVVMASIEHPLAIGFNELPLFAVFAQNQATATAGQLNPPLWSLGVEVMFYVAFPVIGGLLIAAIRRWGRAGALVVAAALTAFGLLWTTYAHLTGDDPLLVASLPTYLPIFACGIATAALLHGRTIDRAQRTVLLVAGAALVVLDGWWHHDSTGLAGHVLRDLPAGVGFAMVAAAVAQGPAWVLGSPPLRRLGDYSYGIYLWHMPVLYVLRHDERWPQSPWEAFAVVFGIATILGALSWHLIEHRVATWASTRLRTRPPAAPNNDELPARPVAPTGSLTPTSASVLGLAGGHRPHQRRPHRSGHEQRTHLTWAPPSNHLAGHDERPVVRVRRVAQARR